MKKFESSRFRINRKTLSLIGENWPKCLETFIDFVISFVSEINNVTSISLNWKLMFTETLEGEGRDSVLCKLRYLRRFNWPE